MWTVEVDRPDRPLPWIARLPELRDARAAAVAVLADQPGVTAHERVRLALLGRG